MVTAVKVIERITLVAPLGLRFLDTVSGAPVGDGLLVTASPAANPERRVHAFTNPSGIYVLRSLPDLRDFENGIGDAPFWAQLQLKQPFVIEVVDLERRFIPFRFSVDLPVRDLFVWEDPSSGSPPAKMLGLPLYSAPNRSVPAAMAVLRADLWDPEGGSDQKGAPAAWALLQARLPAGRVVRAIADEKGRVALIFAYPEPVMDDLGSPPGAPPGSPPGSPPGAGPSLKEQEWALELEAAYERRIPVPQIPDVRVVLTQPPARLWADKDRTQLLAKERLRFGQELILRTRDFTEDPIEGRPMPELLITPAGSPP